MKTLGMILLLLFTTQIMGQELELSSAEKFNKRGYFNNEDIKISGNEIVSDYDGNFIFSYPLVNVDLPDNLSGDLTLTYNANVEHRFTYLPGEQDHMINAPAWIIGYKGIALQTLNFETNRYSYNYNSPTPKSNFIDSELPLLISGYHISNSTSTLSDSYDIIQILRSDGSKIILQNSDMNSYTGLYRELGANSTGLAIVQYYDHPETDIDDAPISKNYRKITYKPGDGLTYVFFEDKIKLDPTYAPDYSLIQFYPKTIYLREISNHNGIILHFFYTDALPSGVELTNGRKVLQSIQRSYGGIFGMGLVDLLYSNTSTHLNRIVIDNIQNNNKLTLNLDNTTSVANTFNASYYDNGSRILRISSIEDQLQRLVKFQYNNQQDRTYTFSTKTGTYNYYLISEIKHCVQNASQQEFNSGRKTILEFFGKYFPGYTGSEYISLDVTRKELPFNMNLTYRDCYTNFMLKKRTIYDSYYNTEDNTFKESVPVRNETYEYSKDATFCDHVSNAWVEGIKTEITTAELTQTQSDVSEVSKKKVTKIYNQYRTSRVDYNTGDRSKTVKLINETIIDLTNTSNKVENITSYDDGVFHDYAVSSWDYWDGTFNVTNVQTKKLYGGGQQIILNEDHNFTTSDIYLNGASRRDTIKILTALEITDSKGVTKRTEYLKFGQNQYTSSDYTSLFTPVLQNNLIDYGNSNYFFGYYLVNITKFEKVSSASAIKEMKRYSYNSYYPYLGKVDTVVTINSLTLNTKNIRTIYKDQNSFFLGLPKEIIFEGKAKQIFEYPTEIIFQNYFDCTQVKNDSQESQIRIYHDGFQTQPLIKKLQYDTNKEIKTFTSFSKEGNLQFEIDANGYYSEFAYDKCNRMLAAAFPGSFVQTGSPFIDNTYLIAENTFSRNTNNALIGLNTNSYIIAELNSDGTTKTSTFIFFGNQVTAASTDSVKLVLDLDANFIEPLGDDSPRIKIGLISVPYSGTTDYSTTVTKQLSLPQVYWEGVKRHTFDITSIASGNGFYGLRVDVEISLGRSLTPVTGYAYHITRTPILQILNTNSQSVYAPPIIEQQGVTASKRLTYLDEYNMISVFDRTNTSIANRSEIESIYYYNGFGKQKAFYGKNGSTLQLKSDKNFDYNGNIIFENTAGEVKREFQYDFLGRITGEKYVGGNFKTYNYVTGSASMSGINYDEKVIITDQEGKTDTIFYDKVGNKIAEKNGSQNPTRFLYDSIYRLTSVISPEGKVTSYSYDGWNNLSSKSSPDEGTYFYSYDKWGNLRFHYHESKSTEVSYNNYDDLNRLLSSGIINNNGFSGLNPDSSQPGTENTAVLINMYDSYTASGVFSSLNLGSVTLRNLNGRLAATAYRDKPGDPWNYKVYSYDHLGRVESNFIYE